MPRTIVYAVHGFLGKASDWDEIKKALPEVDFFAEELFSKSSQVSYEPGQTKKIFLGYSLGGRLGLQILKKNHDAFDHYIFLSTGPGLENSAVEERKNRIENDKKWAEKINLENWDQFLKEWNAQSVFQGSAQEPRRDIEFYDLLKLKNALIDWSLGKQEDFSDLIRAHQNKITWVVGDRDEKYCQIAENLKNKNAVAEYIKVSAGHRIWLDNPEAVVNIINRIVISIS